MRWEGKSVAAIADNKLEPTEEVLRNIFNVTEKNKTGRKFLQG